MSPIERSGGGGGGTTSPLTTKGDVYTFSTVNARLPVGTNTQVLTANSAATTGNDWEYPPGHEFDYVQITANVTVTTASPSFTTVITGNSVTYDGSTRILVMFYAPVIEAASGANSFVAIYLFDGATNLGEVVGSNNPGGTAVIDLPASGFLFITPSAGAHQYIAQAQRQTGGSNGIVAAGTGGAGNFVPAFLRVTKA